MQTWNLSLLLTDHVVTNQKSTPLWALVCWVHEMSSNPSPVYPCAPFQGLDYETKKAYTFKVDATNAHLDPRFQSFGAFKDTATVKINVLDVDEPPVFNKASYVMDVYEDTPVGTIIGAVTAQDLDAGSSPVR